MSLCESSCHKPPPLESVSFSFTRDCDNNLPEESQIKGILRSNSSNTRSSCATASAAASSSSVTTDTPATRDRKVRFHDSAVLIHPTPNHDDDNDNHDKNNNDIHNNTNIPYLWYRGHEIRRMKQAAVPLLKQVDNGKRMDDSLEQWTEDGMKAKIDPASSSHSNLHQSEPTHEWVSVRGLEFGTREGQIRKAEALHFQNILLQAQQQGQQQQQQQKQDNEKNEASTLTSSTIIAERLAELSRQRSEPAVDRALRLAIQDASFVCLHQEEIMAAEAASDGNTTGSTPFGLATQPPPLVWATRQGAKRLRQIWRKLGLRRHWAWFVSSLSSQKDGLQEHGYQLPGAGKELHSITTGGNRPRVDTESTATWLAD